MNPQKKIVDLFDLTGHVALIIGGNRGLGLSMAKALAGAGASICIAARDEKVSEGAANELIIWQAPLQALRRAAVLRSMAVGSPV